MENFVNWDSKPASAHGLDLLDDYIFNEMFKQEPINTENDNHTLEYLLNCSFSEDCRVASVPDTVVKPINVVNCQEQPAFSLQPSSAVQDDIIALLLKQKEDLLFRTNLVTEVSNLLTNQIGTLTTNCQELAELLNRMSTPHLQQLRDQLHQQSQLQSQEMLNAAAFSSSSTNNKLLPTEKPSSQVPQAARTVRKSIHTVIEKRYRSSINDRIDELRTVLGIECVKLSKSCVLRKALDRIRHLERDNEKLRKQTQGFSVGLSKDHFRTKSSASGSLAGRLSDVDSDSASSMFGSVCETEALNNKNRGSLLHSLLESIPRGASSGGGGSLLFMIPCMLALCLLSPVLYNDTIGSAQRSTHHDSLLYQPVGSRKLRGLELPMSMEEAARRTNPSSSVCLFLMLVVWMLLLLSFLASGRRYLTRWLGLGKCVEVAAAVADYNPTFWRHWLQAEKDLSMGRCESATTHLTSALVTVDWPNTPRLLCSWLLPSVFTFNQRHAAAALRCHSRLLQLRLRCEAASCCQLLITWILVNLADAELSLLERLEIQMMLGAAAAQCLPGWLGEPLARYFFTTCSQLVQEKEHSGTSREISLQRFRWITTNKGFDFLCCAGWLESARGTPQHWYILNLATTAFRRHVNKYSLDALVNADVKRQRNALVLLSLFAADAKHVEDEEGWFEALILNEIISSLALEQSVAHFDEMICAEQLPLVLRGNCLPEGLLLAYRARLACADDVVEPDVLRGWCDSGASALAEVVHQQHGEESRAILCWCLLGLDWLLTARARLLDTGSGQLLRYQHDLEALRALVITLEADVRRWLWFHEAALRLLSGANPLNTQVLLRRYCAADAELEQPTEQVVKAAIRRLLLCRRHHMIHEAAHI